MWHDYLLSVSRQYRAELDLVLMAAAKELEGGKVKQELKQELKAKNVSERGRHSDLTQE